MITKTSLSSKSTFGAFLLALIATAMLLIATAMLGACSSTQESGADTPGKNCAEQCAGVSEGDQDECLIACEA